MADTTDQWYLSGPLGIGTTSPQQQLSITGGIGFANQNDVDKKLYSPADGVLEWMTHDWAGQHGLAVSHQGQQRVFLNTAGNSYFDGGNVGIGTTNPAQKLHIAGAIRTDGNRTFINGFDGATNHWIRTNGSTEADSVFLALCGTSDGTALAVHIAPRARTGLFVNSDGNVGIGMTGPNARLSVVGSGAGEIVGTAQSSTFRTSAGSLGAAQGSELSLASIGFHSGNNTSLGVRAHRFTHGSDWTTAAIGFGIDVDATVRVNDASLWLHPLGGVGISTSNPQAKLHVNGDVIVQGNIAVQGKPLSFFENWGGLRTQDVQADGSIWCANEIYAKDAKVLKSDIAENYVSCLNLSAGDVVSISGFDGTISLSEKPNDVLVLGVISTDPGLVLNAERDAKKGMYPVALSGRVPCKAVDENGPISCGDLLTSSSTPGHAMKANPIITKSGDEFYRPGTIIGKSLGSLNSGTGIIYIFVFSC